VDVVGLGASSVDYVNVLPVAPEAAGANAKLRISRHFVACGGQVANAVAACAALGLQTRFLGPMGTDANGQRVRAELAARGVDVSAAIVREADNQFAVILVDERSGERIVLWDRDARLQISRADLDPALFADARVLHVDDVDEDGAIAAARMATVQGLTVTSDLDRLTDRTAALVASVTIPIFASHVPGALTGERDLERALRALRRAHHTLLVVTLGADGAIALIDDRIVRSAAFAVDAVDTTGAGDVFRAGLIYGLLADWPIENSLRFANAAAAVSCTRLGAMSAVPTRREVEELIQRQPLSR
jgi:sugar/nucleoside kinase (ribokinase family)